MTSIEIIQIINSIEKECKAYQDGGRTFVAHLSRKLLNIAGEDKEDFLNFLLNEIKTDENGYCSTAIITITDMGLVEYAPQIVQIYDELSSLKDETWKHSVVESLMRLRYSPPQFLYADYVTSYLQKYKYKSFCFLVLYCNVNIDKALSLIADIYSTYLLDKEVASFLEGKIYFLVNAFIQNSTDYLPKLVEQVYAKNEKAGLYLKNIVIDYLMNKLPQYIKYYPSNFKNVVNERIKHLNDIKLSSLTT